MQAAVTQQTSTYKQLVGVGVGVDAGRGGGRIGFDSDRTEEDQTRRRKAWIEALRSAS